MWIVYFERHTQNVIGEQAHWKMGDMLLLILKVGDSFSWSSE